MTVAQQIRERLQAVFAPRRLEVSDDSESHRGHSGWREGGETHFSVIIEAPAFTGMSRVDRHRAVHRALGEDLVGRIHALAITVRD